MTILSNGLELTATNMKQTLWDVFNSLKNKSISPQEADAIAIQAREIIRVIKTQQGILQQAHKDVTEELIGYATK